MKNVYLDSSTQETGRFLFWTWELWSIGCGSGVEWYFFGKQISPGGKNILWDWFDFQRWYRGVIIKKIKNLYNGFLWEVENVLCWAFTKVHTHRRNLID